MDENQLVTECVSRVTITNAHDEMITDLEPVWNDALYTPTEKPFDYTTQRIGASELAEEVERITGIPGKLAHKIIICGWKIQELRRECSIFSLAQNVALLTGEAEHTCYLTLMTEDYLYWKNGINKPSRPRAPMITEIGLPQWRIEEVLADYRKLAKISAALDYPYSPAPLDSLLWFIEDVLLPAFVQANRNDLDSEKLKDLVLSDASDEDVLKVLLNTDHHDEPNE